MQPACYSVVWQHTVAFNVETVLNDWEIKIVNYKSLLPFQILVGLFLNFRKIEPTVSYKAFRMKNTCIVLTNHGMACTKVQTDYMLARITCYDCLTAISFSYAKFPAYEFPCKISYFVS